MENKAIEGLINLLTLTDQEEGAFYIKGLLCGQKIKMDLHIELEGGDIKDMKITKGHYISRKTEKP
jgi:hypothetical protein